MFIGKKYIYFELQKAASSQVRKVLRKIPELSFVKVGVHNSYYEVNPKVLGNFSDKVKIGSIRNPWDWYVSLWIWGCAGYGIYQNLIMPRNLKGLFYALNHPVAFMKKRKEWQKVYSDPDNYQNFRNWLKMLVLERNFEIGDGFAASKIANYSGYLTYCYLKLHTLQFDTEQLKVSDYDDIINLDQSNNFIDYIIRAEKLEEDLIKALLSLGITLNEINKVLKQSEGRANSTVRGDYHLYYDDETRQLVEEREKFIIDKYNYTY